MAEFDMIDATAWAAMLLGAFTLAAAIGALRKPGLWQAMVREIEQSPALQLLCGLVELMLGAAVYLANPWIPADILTCIMKTLGGIMIAEALVVLAFSDLYFHFWLRNLAHMQRTWVILTFVFGLALTVAGLARLA
ncbi:hypothetical protein SLG_03670 [Sphingobium sp. SYK-6]|uniref:hypothetical protein n=1 Tax=Sphingobium sp. (strain NBRC 103272 / SYK-6) TaxID=627192 RepID=UPI0002276E7B|nr:hypothetical protein [Sphingobium sp. SYK-6]BAK65042.1 hypothetical protein SLG_03670 [Sphingobium sp. SYK-6]